MPISKGQEASVRLAETMIFFSMYRDYMLWFIPVVSISESFCALSIHLTPITHVPPTHFIHPWIRVLNIPDGMGNMYLGMNLEWSLISPPPSYFWQFFLCRVFIVRLMHLFLFNTITITCYNHETCFLYR